MGQVLHWTVIAHSEYSTADLLSFISSHKWFWAKANKAGLTSSEKEVHPPRADYEVKQINQDFSWYLQIKVQWASMRWGLEVKRSIKVEKLREVFAKQNKPKNRNQFSIWFTINRPELNTHTLKFTEKCSSWLTFTLLFNYLALSTSPHLQIDSMSNLYSIRGGAHCIAQQLFRTHTEKGWGCHSNTIWHYLLLLPLSTLLSRPSSSLADCFIFFTLWFIWTKSEFKGMLC